MSLIFYNTFIKISLMFLCWAWADFRGDDRTISENPWLSEVEREGGDTFKSLAGGEGNRISAYGVVAILSVGCIILPAPYTYLDLMNN